ncbi:TniQ family protein [Hungatella hathewayi]|uniref:TniQ family protein n=1 Tax=Hungatella hathewayi TaxID=154046 RepID=UPI003567B918
MLNFFPTLYPDELWYSAICRYHVWSGNPKPIESIRDLFQGRSYVDVGTVNPSNSIHDIIEQIPDGILDYKDIAIKHTLFNYAYRFQPIEAKNKMLYTIKAGTIHWPGAISTPKKTYPRLKYCPICRIEDKNTYGEVFWHVSHQIPLATICLKHRCRLITYVCSGLKDLDMKLLLPDVCTDDTVDYRIEPYEDFLNETVITYFKMPMEITPSFGFNNLFEELYNTGYGILRKDTGYQLNVKKLTNDLCIMFGDAFVREYFGKLERMECALKRLKFYWAKSPERYAILATFLKQPIEITFSKNKIKNELFTGFLNFQKAYNGQPKKYIADRLGIPDRVMDSLALYLGVEPFWKNEIPVKNSTIVFRLTAAEKKRIQDFVKREGYKNYSEFIMYCIKKELDVNI